MGVGNDDGLFATLSDPHRDTMILRCLTRRPGAVQALAGASTVCMRPNGRRSAAAGRTGADVSCL
jgi:hypothetical protein